MAYFKPVRAPALALGAIALLGTLQALAWPAGLVGWISPEHLEAHRATAEMIGKGKGEVISSGAPHLSLAPEVSRRVALGWAALAALVAVAGVVGRHRWHRRALAGGLLAAAFFQIFYGARRWLSGLTTIWGVEVPGSSDRLRGTFVNPDHLALFLEIGLAVVFAWSWWALRQSARRHRWERRLLLVGPPLICWCFLFVALAFTGSRAGLVAAVIGVAVQTFLLLWLDGRHRWRAVGVGLGAVVIGLLAIGVTGARFGFGRLLATSPYEVTFGARFEAIRSSLTLWQEYPWLGTGLGTFRDAFPVVQPLTIRGGSWRHAHSDVVELGVTTGVLGCLLFATGLAFLLVHLVRVLRWGWSSEDRAAGLAALGAIAAVGAHEWVDFGLTMPANSLALAVVCGAAAAARLDLEKVTSPGVKRTGAKDSSSR